MTTWPSATPTHGTGTQHHSSTGSPTEFRQQDRPCHYHTCVHIKQKKGVRTVNAFYKWETEATQVTRLTQCLTGSPVKTPDQWEAVVENKNKMETTERIRLHIERTERGVGYCQTTTLICILSHTEACWSDYFLSECYSNFRIREGQ